MKIARLNAPTSSNSGKLRKINTLVSKVWQLITDLSGLFLVVAPAQALKYALLFLSTLPEVVRSHSLGAVDLKIGIGPFNLRNNKKHFQLVGLQVMGLIREIWVRRIYLADGFLSIKPDSTVVDLGANIGVFTTFAATYVVEGEIIAVEAQGKLVEDLTKNVQQNGLESKVTILHGIVGANSGVITRMRDNSDVPLTTFSINEILTISGSTTIDFLKVDIEGSEFDLFTASNSFLPNVKQLAMEVHFDYGKLATLQAKCEQAGFECRVAKMNSPKMCILYGRRMTN